MNNIAYNPKKCGCIVVRLGLEKRAPEKLGALLAVTLRRARGRRRMSYSYAHGGYVTSTWNKTKESLRRATSSHDHETSKDDARRIKYHLIFR
jgi:hypothetical protein